MNLINKIGSFFKFSVNTQFHNSMEQLLSEIKTLLRAYNFQLEANTVEGVIQILQLDNNKACHLMVAESWWVGADALAEANLGIAGGYTSQARFDQERFQALNIELYQLLQHEGYESDVARLVTNQFNKWRVSRV